MLIKSLSVLAAAAALTSAPASAQLLNGSFELPVVGPGGEVPVSSGTVVGFSEFGGTSFVVGNADLASDGLQALKVFGPFGDGGSGVLQTIAAGEGQTWVAEIDSLNSGTDLNQQGSSFLQISFLDGDGNFAGNGGEQGEGLNFFSASAGDASLQVDAYTRFGIGTAPSPVGTEQVRLTLVRLNANFAGGSQFFDNATLAQGDPVPEPASLALLAGGGLMLLRRRGR